MSSRNLGALTLDLIAKTGGFEQGMDRAARKADDVSRQIKRSMAEVKSALSNAFAGILAGVSFAAVVNQVKATTDSMLQLGIAAKRVAMPVEQFSTMSAAAKNADVDVQTFTTSLQKLDKQLAAAKQGNAQAKSAFAAIGLDPSKLKDTRQATLAVADAFHKYKDDANKVALAQQLLGRSGAAMIGFLDQGSASIQAQQKHLADLGLAIDDVTQAKLAAFDAQVKELHNTFDGLKMQIVSGLLPALTAITKDFADTAQGAHNVDQVGSRLGDTLNVLAAMSHAVAGGFKLIAAAVEEVVTAAAAQIKLYGDAFDLLKNPFSKQNWKQALAGMKSDVSAALDQTKDIWNKATTGMTASYDAMMSAFGRVGKRTVPNAPAASGPAANAPSIHLADPNAAAKAKAAADALAKAYGALFAEIQAINSADDPTKKIVGDYEARIRKLAELGAAAIKAGADTQQVQAAVAAGAAKLNAQMVEALQAPMRAAKEYENGLKAQLKAQQDAIDLQVKAVGMGDKQAANMRELNRIQQEGAAALLKLQQDRDLHPLAMTPEQYKAEVDATEKHYADLLSRTKKGQADLSAAEADWHNGVTRSIDNFLEKMHNQAQQAQDFMDSFIGGFGDAFSKFASGTESAKKAFGDLIDSLYANALKFLADKAMQEFFKSIQGNGSGSNDSGGGWGGLISGIASLFGGGKAAGGLVDAGRMYRVNENGPEMLNVGGKDFLMMGKQPGWITPNASNAQRYSNGGVTNIVNVQPTSTRRTADQIATAIARKQRIATARG